MNREEMLRLADAEMQRAQETLEAQHAYEMEILKAIRQIYQPKRKERVQMTTEDMTPMTIEKLWEIVRAVADSDCTYYDDFDIYCIFQCGGQDDYKGHFTHSENCPSMKARAVVEQARTRKQEQSS